MTVIPAAMGIHSPAHDVGATVRASMPRNNGTAVVDASMRASDCRPSHIAIHIDGKRGASFSLANPDHGGRFGSGYTKSERGSSK